MRARPGALVAKGGAEGVHAVGVLAGNAGGGEDGAIGVALKIEDGDGARRAASVASCAALSQLGTLDADALASLADYAAPPIRDPRGDVSGSVQPAFILG